MESINITIIQSDQKGSNIRQNLDHLDQLMQNCSETDLLVLPEVFNTGVGTDPTETAESMEGTTMDWMQKKAQKYDAAITGSLPIKENGNFFNRMIWMQPNGRYEHYDKRHLFRLSKEYKDYKPGNKRTIVEYKNWSFCLQVCYDLRFPVWSRNQEEFDCLLYVANWPNERSYAWNMLLPARAIENQCYVIGVNRVGKGKRGEYHAGDSMAADPRGRILSRTAHQETFQNVTLKKQRIENTREKIPFLMDRESFTLG